MENFSIEYNHTDAQVPQFADRCGCVKCERFRETADRAQYAAPHVPATQPRNVAVSARPANEQPVRGPAAAMARQTATPVADVVRADIARGAAPALATNQTVRELTEVEARDARRANGGYCACAMGTRRPAVRNGSGVDMCPDCNFPRRTRGSYANVPSVAQSTEHNRQMGAALGVQANTGSASPTGERGELLTPREQVIREIEGKLSAQLGATHRDLRKWDTLLRSTTVSASANPTGYVRHTEVVAGARTNASGIFLGFGGLGSLTRAELAAIIADAGMPAEWLPAPKSAHAQAGRIVGNLSRHGYIVRAARVPVRAGKPQTTEERGWVARWNVGQAQLGSQVGGTYGTTLLVVSLRPGGELHIEGREDLALTVRTEYTAACAAETYAAADVSSWLASTLMGRFRAAAVGGNWYVRRRYANDAEKLCTSLSKHWGRNWLLPAIPMTTTDELCQGLVKNFSDEVDVVLATYRAELAEAQKHGETEIGARRAATLLGEVRTLAERAVGFASMFGDRHMMTLREKLCVAADEIANSVDGISQRFSLIFDELRRDAARDGDS